MRLTALLNCAVKFILITVVTVVTVSSFLPPDHSLLLWTAFYHYLIAVLFTFNCRLIPFLSVLVPFLSVLYLSAFAILFIISLTVYNTFISIYIQPYSSHSLRFYSLIVLHLSSSAFLFLYSLTPFLICVSSP
jgi:hypothetical protein